jgi:hypothetical protein
VENGSYRAVMHEKIKIILLGTLSPVHGKNFQLSTMSNSSLLTSVQTVKWIPLMIVGLAGDTDIPSHWISSRELQFRGK